LTRRFGAGLLLAVAVASSALTGCARTQKPVLYPNAKFREVGRPQAERDIEECRTLAQEYVESSAGKDVGRGAVGGAAGGAAVGAVAGTVSGRGAGSGAAVGAATGATAGVVRGAFQQTAPSPVYKGFVSRCLKERGYDVIGWQ